MNVYQNDAIKRFVSDVSGKTSGVRDKPLTFHSKVKSSGYSAAPRYVLAV